MLLSWKIVKLAVSFQPTMASWDCSSISKLWRVRFRSVISLFPDWSCSVLVEISLFSSPLWNGKKQIVILLFWILNSPLHAFGCICYLCGCYFFIEPCFSLFTVLLGDDFILSPHVIQKLGEVNSWSSIHFNADLANCIALEALKLLERFEIKDSVNKRQNSSTRNIYREIGVM